MTEIKVEEGIVVGTTGDKYISRNPIARYLVRNFDAAIAGIAGSVPAKHILEIGCGEGHVTQLLLDNSTAEILATDISESVISQTSSALNNERVNYQVGRLENIKVSYNPDFVVCCEVLEHLPDPHLGLNALQSFSADWYLLSVPREPIWRIMNMARGSYLSDWGNSPGHIQHWSKHNFVSLVSEYFNVVEVKSPLPWTVLLCQPRS